MAHVSKHSSNYPSNPVVLLLVCLIYLSPFCSALKSRKLALKIKDFSNWVKAEVMRRKAFDRGYEEFINKHKTPLPNRFHSSDERIEGELKHTENINPHSIDIGEFIEPTEKIKDHQKKPKKSQKEEQKVHWTDF